MTFLILGYHANCYTTSVLSGVTSHQWFSTFTNMGTPSQVKENLCIVHIRLMVVILGAPLLEEMHDYRKLLIIDTL
jgi:hypothetical protein